MFIKAASHCLSNNKLILLTAASSLVTDFASDFKTVLLLSQNRFVPSKACRHVETKANVNES